MDKSKIRNQFQIRKVPLRRVLPERTLELNALDVHSICLPSRSKKNINWRNINSQHNYEEQFNPQIIHSPAYQQLYSQFLALREQCAQEKNQVKQEIEKVGVSISQEEEKQQKLQYMRQGLYLEIEKLRQNLNEVRDKNYNLRWEIYHQRGAHYMNVNGYSFLHGGQMTYEELLQMEQHMGSIPKGLTEEQITTIPLKNYEIKDNNQQICCICFNEIEQNQQIPALQCHHYHHTDCLHDWLLKQRFCPICKHEITPP